MIKMMIIDYLIVTTMMKMKRNCDVDKEEETEFARRKKIIGWKEKESIIIISFLFKFYYD